MRKKSLLLFTFIFIAYFFVCGQDWVYRQYKVNDGLPSSQVYEVLQDKDEYIWFATDRGVTRFDGYTFKDFSAMGEFGRNAVFQLQKDALDRIWISVTGRELYYYENDQFVPYEFNDKLLKILDSRVVKLFHCDASKTLWLSLNYSKSDTEIVTIDSLGNIEYISSKLFPKMDYLYRASRSQVYIPTGPMIDDGSDRFEVERNQLTHKILECVSPKVDSLRYFSHYYVSDQFLCSYGAGKGKICVKIPNIVTNSITVTRGNNLWLGVHNKGAYLFKDGDLSKSPEVFLPGKSVTSILRDKEGGYWFTTLYSGVYYSTNLNSVVYSEKHGLADNNISSIYSSNDELFIGHSSGRITELTKKENRWSVARQFTGFGNIYRFASSRKYKGVILSNNPKANIPEGFSVSEYRCYLEKGDMTFSLNSKRVLTTKHLDSVVEKVKLPLIFPRSLGFSEKYGVLIGTTHGLQNYKNGQLHELKSINPLFRLRIQRIEELNGWHLISTIGGGMLFWNEKELLQLSADDGLSNNTCNDFFVENDSTVWVCTNKGINRVSMSLSKKKVWVSGRYSLENGLVSNETLSCFSDSKYLWIATRKGINRILISSLKRNKYAAPVYIIEGVLGNVKLARENMSVGHRHNTFRVNFVGLTYKSSNRLHYEFRLLGAGSKNWRRTDERQLTYVNLTPGDYKFEVRAVSNSGVRSEKVASLSFTIKTPFWQSSWFYVLVIVSIIIILVLFNALNIRRIKRRERLLKELDRYKDRALRSQMNPHFIYNSLNTIQSFILKEDSKNSMTYLSKFSKLMRMTFKNSSGSIVSLKDDLQALKLYTDLEKIRYPGSLEIAFDVDTNVQDYLIPPLLLQPFVENAIFHGVLPNRNRDSGKILVSIKERNDKLYITIEDNGIGIEASKLIRVKKKRIVMTPKRETRRDSQDKEVSGFSVTEKRILLFNSEHKHTPSSVSIYSSESGTKIEFSLPRIMNNYD